jgi:hypothetical protein
MPAVRILDLITSTPTGLWAGIIYRADASILDIHSVGALLSVKGETIFKKYCFEKFPMDRCQARHSVPQVPLTRNGIGTVMVLAGLSDSLRLGFGAIEKPHSFITASRVPLS